MAQNQTFSQIQHKFLTIERYSFMILTRLLFLIALTWISCNTTSDGIVRKSPNILLILTDDQGYPTPGCYGGEKVPTPALDQLATSGIRFTDAYVTSQCTPTRASLLTGQYTIRNGMWHVIGWYGYPWARMSEAPFREQLDRERFTLAKGLQEAGYETAIFGKWHLTTNDDGHYMGINPEAARHYGFNHAGPVIDKRFFEEGSDRGIRTFTEQALEWIGENRDTPWFCLVSHHMIHGTVVAPDSLVQQYRSRGYGEEGPDRAIYLAGLELIDWSVGELSRGLQQLGEAEETLILFVSDNGGINERYDPKGVDVDSPEGMTLPVSRREYSNAPLRAGKGSVYEGGVRVPMLLNAPGIAQEGLVVSAPVHIIDLLPTFLELAGSSAEFDSDGESLVPLFEGNASNAFAERPIYQYYPFYDLLWQLTPSASIRQGDYKLIEFWGDRFDEAGRYRIGHHVALYNLSTDIGEQINLTDTQPAIRDSLLKKLHTWLIDHDAAIPAQNPHYDPGRAFESTREKPDWISPYRLNSRPGR